MNICFDSEVTLRALVVPATHSGLIGERKEALWRVAKRNRFYGYRDTLRSEATR